MTLIKLRQEIKKSATKKRAEANAWFFKTGPGQYGEGDKFIGLTVPQSRVLAIKYKDLTFPDLTQLLRSPIHEERLIALLILIEQFGHADPVTQQKIYSFYLKSTKYINNWDLVDLSAPNIVGFYLFKNSRKILFKLAKSKNLWERRIAIISTFYFIRFKQFEETIKISEILMNDSHDLIQKAVGWMLREMGKKNEGVLIKFLNKYYKKMPRTSLRYAIERLKPKQKTFYMAK